MKHNNDVVYLTNSYTFGTYSECVRAIYNRIVPVGGVVRFLVDDCPVEGEVHLARREYIVIDGGTMALLEDVNDEE